MDKWIAQFLTLFFLLSPARMESRKNSLTAPKYLSIASHKSGDDIYLFNGTPGACFVKESYYDEQHYRITLVSVDGSISGDGITTTHL